MKLDLTGQRFGRLVAIKENGRSKSRQVLWLCQCDCGNTHIVPSSQLKNASIRSCGCLRSEMVAAKNYKHGLMDSRLYHVWTSIKDRCYREKNHHYKYYGKRGIRLCDEWQSFENFYTWAINNGYDPDAPRGECTIDRINPDGDYEPNNCRWVSNTVQQRNKRNNHYLTYKGETHPVTEWAEILGMGKGTLETRINKYGWSIERAFNTPVRKCNRSGTNRYLTFNNKTQTITQWAKEFGMGFNTLYSRLFDYQWPVEKALMTPVRKLKRRETNE